MAVVDTAEHLVPMASRSLLWSSLPREVRWSLSLFSFLRFLKITLFRLIKAFGAAQFHMETGCCCSFICRWTFWHHSAKQKGLLGSIYPSVCLQKCPMHAAPAGCLPSLLLLVTGSRDLRRQLLKHTSMCHLWPFPQLVWLCLGVITDIPNPNHSLRIAAIGCLGLKELQYVNILNKEIFLLTNWAGVVNRITVFRASMKTAIKSLNWHRKFSSFQNAAGRLQPGTNWRKETHCSCSPGVVQFALFSRLRSRCWLSPLNSLMGWDQRIRRAISTPTIIPASEISGGRPSLGPYGGLLDQDQKSRASLLWHPNSEIHLWGRIAWHRLGLISEETDFNFWLYFTPVLVVWHHCFLS